MRMCTYPPAPHYTHTFPHFYTHTLTYTHAACRSWWVASPAWWAMSWSVSCLCCARLWRLRRTPSCLQRGHLTFTRARCPTRPSSTRYLWAHARTPTHTHTDADARTCSCTRMHTHTDPHAHMQTYTHTHAQGMLRSVVVGSFFMDLANPACETSFAIYHRRFSTNTTPKWPLAQPMRILGHNGACCCVCLCVCVCAFGRTCPLISPNTCATTMRRARFYVLMCVCAYLDVCLPAGVYPSEHVFMCRKNRAKSSSMHRSTIH